MGDAHLFSEREIPYAIIGGMGVQHWGEPRFTQDVDMTVSVPLNETEDVVRIIITRFSPRIEDPVAFARRARIVLVRASNGCGVHISLAIPGYGDEVMRRAVSYELEPGKVIRLCSAEDLIIPLTLLFPVVSPTPLPVGRGSAPVAR